MGQSPFWDIDQQSLFYTDTLGGNIYKYDLMTDKHTMAKIRK